MEDAIEALTQRSHRAEFAGRTDAGVHALGQVAVISTTKELPRDRWVQGVNHFLPSAVAVQDAREVPSGFDPRRDATDRTYHYDVRLAATPQPLRERRAWVFSGGLRLPLMQEAAAQLVGEHDFASFCAKPGEAGTVRTLHEVGVQAFPEAGGDRFRFTLRGESFLHHQVRLTVGQLVRIGLERVEPSTIGRLLAQPEVGQAGPKAPAQGLVLVRVGYRIPELADWNDNEDVCTVGR